ncbi:hypothetical protein OCH239_10940 [Roseivivax halodurans JCM 10272]|uniref:Peptidase M10 serralysin C-terminal domain-containing protein n=1 Tax=Roseivivax halodurans JCM 10272 TaxID=1449350 RepID=X7EDU3_9RHOB|nr:hypothetical protein OCH239_10940 [Roseivivax halodurans JCM 10272]
MDGGTGRDILIGGVGADIFEFGPATGKDIIRDFAAGEDLIRIGVAGLTYEDLSLSAVRDGLVVTGFDDQDSEFVVTGVWALTEDHFLFT